MAKPLERAIPNPPLPVFTVTGDLMVHHFDKRPLLNNAGALQYAYTTFGAQMHNLVGAGTGMRQQGLRAITIPLVSMPVTVMQGIGYQPGSMTTTPVSDEGGAVNYGGPV